MNMHYIKLNASSLEYKSTIELLAKKFKQVTGSNQLSVNRNKEGTAAWIKVHADHGVAGPILLADLPEAEVEMVRAEISQPGWVDQSFSPRSLLALRS